MSYLCKHYLLSAQYKFWIFEKQHCLSFFMDEWMDVLPNWFVDGCILNMTNEWPTNGWFVFVEQCTLPALVNQTTFSKGATRVSLSSGIEEPCFTNRFMYENLFKSYFLNLYIVMVL